MENVITKKFNKITFTQGVLMWSILILGYILFVVNWLVMGKIAGQAGTNGWIDYFFHNSNPPTILTQAINYTITFMRGIGSFLVGYMVAKFTHKWASIISLILIVMAIPAIWMPVGGYGGFIFFRMLLAIGGTTLIVYIQPVMAKSMTQKRKGFFSAVSPFGFNIGTIIAVAPFMVPSIATMLTNNWQITGTIFACLTIIPLILYFFFGRNFSSDKQEAIDQNDKEILPYQTSKILKEKQTWIWVFLYGSWLVIAVIPIIALFPDALKLFHTSIDGMSIKQAHSIFVILYVAGVFLSPFTIGRWNVTDAKRKPYITFIGIMIILSLSIVVISWAFGSLIAFFIFGFISGWFVWSIQGVILNNPHERKGNTPKRISTLFGFIWGFGYMFFTFANIILALLMPSNPVLINGIIMLVIFFVFVLMFPISVLFIKETKPDGNLLPSKWIKKTINNENKELIKKEE